ncbi:MAG: apolipoprotein N-acyltransferase [Motilibacteraceae bacterium]
MTAGPDASTGAPSDAPGDRSTSVRPTVTAQDLLKIPGAGARGAASGRVPPWPLPVAAVLAVLAGLLTTFAFPPYGLWPLALAAPTALALLVAGRSPGAGALLGLATGLGFFVPLLHWTGTYVGPFPWLLLAVVEAAYLAPLGALVVLVRRVPAWPLWAAAAWVAQEALRDRWPFGGFPWGRLAFSQADAPTLGLAALGGAPLVTFAVALAGCLLAAAVPLLVAVLRAGRGRLPSAAAVAAALVVLLAGLAVPATAPTGPTVQVALVQGNVPRLGLDFNAQRAAVLRNHAEATHALAERVRAGRAPRPDLVVWPENSSDIDPYTDASAAATITAAAQDIGVPVLVGAVVGRSATTVANMGIVWSPTTGPGQTYTKRHPVPFGEYIPLRRIARLLSSDVDRVSRDFVKGDRVGVLQVGPATVGDVICFEVGYDGLVRDVVTGGGQVIAVQTNNATFGFTPQSEQQLAMSRLRAREHARTVLVAATSGVSAVVAPDGGVRQHAGVFTVATFDVPVQLSTARTLATRAGEWPEAALVALALLAALLGLLAGRLRSPDRAPSPYATRARAATSRR